MPRADQGNGAKPVPARSARREFAFPRRARTEVFRYAGSFTYAVVE
jgi:hypothetical protein